MGQLTLNLFGHSVRYYDNAGIVYVDGEVVGRIDEDALDLWRDDSDAERERSWAVIEKQVTAVASNHLVEAE